MIVNFKGFILELFFIALMPLLYVLFVVSTSVLILADFFIKTR